MLVASCVENFLAENLDGKFLVEIFVENFRLNFAGRNFVFVFVITLPCLCHQKMSCQCHILNS